MERFTGKNTAMILIDHQTGTMSWARSNPFEMMKTNALMLAKAATIMDMPIVLTSSMEEFIQGRTENLHDYLIATVGDVPEVEVHLVEKAEPLGPFGAKGVGEHALIPTAPAIMNAIHHATGVRITKIPAIPHRVHAALVAAGVSP